MACVGLIELQEHVAGSCECGNEPSGFVNCEDLPDQLRKSQLLRKDSAPWSGVTAEVVVVWRFRVLTV